MSKPAPLQYGQYYHIYSRGTNGENIFVEERNYRHFLRLYTRYVSPVADTFAYCLLRNHFHLLGRIKTLDELVDRLKREVVLTWFGGVQSAEAAHLKTISDSAIMALVPEDLD
jgi:hypothetical protein